MIFFTIIFLTGIIGGIVNALISDNGFILPKKEIDGIIRPGFLGNAFVGGVTATISWSLYGPLAGMSVFLDTTESSKFFTISTIGGSILAGIAGARWLTNEVDKSLLRTAGSKAARIRQSNMKTIDAFTAGTPAQILQAVQSDLEEEGPNLERQ